MRLSSKSWWKYLIAGLVLAGILLILCFACSKKSENDAIPPADMTKSFTAKADIHFGDVAATATINRIGDGVCDVTLISPQALNGMKFQYNGDQITVSYTGMSVELDDDSLLANAMATAIVKAVDMAARDQGITMKKSGKTIIMKGENDSGEFELRLDKETGSLLELKIPSMDLECTFGADEAETE